MHTNNDYGGAVYCQDSSILINKSSFVENSAYRGGVLYIKHGKVGELEAATIVNSTAFQQYLKVWLGHEHHCNESIKWSDLTSSVIICKFLHKYSYK